MQYRELIEDTEQDDCFIEKKNKLVKDLNLVLKGNESQSYRFHGKTIPDPFRKLHNKDDESVKNWVCQQTEYTRNYLNSFNTYKEIRTDLDRCIGQLECYKHDWPYYEETKSKTNPESSEAVTRGIYTFWFERADNVTHLMYRSNESDEDKILLSSSNIRASGNTAEIKECFPSPNGEFVLVTLRSNILTKHIVVETATGLETKDRFPEDAMFEKWHPDSIGIYYTNYDVFYHKIGDPYYDQDKILDRRKLKNERFDSIVSIIFVDDAYLEHHFSIQIDFKGKYEDEHLSYYIDPEDPKTFHLYPFDEYEQQDIDLFSNADKIIMADSDFIYYRSVSKYDSQTIIKLPVGSKNTQDGNEIITGLARDAYTFPYKNKIIIFTCEKLKDFIRVYDSVGQILFEYEAEEFCSLYPMKDALNENVVKFYSIDFLMNKSEYELDLETFLVKQNKYVNAPTWTNNLRTKRIFIAASDGEEIPVTLLFRQDMDLEQKGKVILNGYGGFNTIIKACGDPLVPWLASQFGVYAIAHIRGDGGWKDHWYKDGVRLNKKRNIQDFIECGEYLAKSEYSSQETICSIGYSNGGLLVSSAMLLKPDLFCGVISGIPVIDMLDTRLGNDHIDNYRYIDEYGIPEIEGDFFNIISYAPLQNISSVDQYPPLLAMAMYEDWNCHPAHSYKLIATLQEKGTKENISLLWQKDHGGHNDLFNKDGMFDLDAFADLAVFFKSCFGKNIE